MAMARLLLRLAPRWFRSRYADEMLETLEGRVEDARARGVGRLGMTSLWLREWWGLAATVVRLRRTRDVDGTDETGRGAGMIESTLQDVKFSLRGLQRNPGFAVSAVVVVALGIGATTAIFSAVNSYFFRPLPFADPDGLVMIYETNPEFGWTDATAAPANALDWRERVDAFQDLALYSSFITETLFIQDGQPELLNGSAVTGNFFSVLGVRPHLGRGFRFEETWAEDSDVVVLSHGLWQSHFGGETEIVGRTIELNGATVEVIGVAPPQFRFPMDDTQFWYPWSWERGARQQVWFRRAHFVRPVARMVPGVSLEAADAELQAVVTRLQEEYPETNSVMGAGVMPLRSFLIKDIQRPLMVLLGASGLLLLLACVNVANLMLLRADDRTREVALRYALGARGRRVARLMITESLAIGLLGGGAGLVLGWVGVRGMERLSRVGIDGATTLALDGRVVFFAAATAILCGSLFGLLPALRATGERVAGVLRAGGRGGAESRRGLRTSNTLVSVEVALAVLLVVGAGLLVRSYLLLRDVDPGFQADGVLAVQFTVPSTRYQSRDDVLAFYDGFLRALDARPGVLATGVVGHLPLAGTSWSSQFQAETWPPDRVGFEIVHRRADAGYFEALDIPLLEGRMYGPNDDPDGPLVVVVNETFVQSHFPGEDPLGQRIAYDRNATPESNWYEIIGIVGDQHQVSPGVPPRPEVFEYRNQDWERTNYVVIETDGDPLDYVATVRDVMREADPLIPFQEIRPLREVWQSSMAQERFILAILVAFGVLALLLSIVGVYTVAAQAARRRSHELGVRMALGAARGDVIRLVLSRGAWVVGGGVVAGLVLAVAVSGALSAQLYAIEPTDPLTLTSVVLILSTVGLAACYLPARRATRIDPVESLRSE